VTRQDGAVSALLRSWLRKQLSSLLSSRTAPSTTRRAARSAAVMDREPLQITVCKCPDTFCPLGPHIITPDEVPDPNANPLEISTRVNGVYKRRTTTDTMIHSIPTLLEFLTQTVTLRPGDLMNSGTCGGTGMGRKPQEFMLPGDTVTVGVSGVGHLTNSLEAGWEQPR
jgi:2-keto-4-pentenoate hydratase/2-oxohepta-3-ene-1,7-dioic acid hydratase in catechol pathway